MSIEGYQLIENEPVDDSIIKNDFLKVYQQQEANLNDSDRNVAFIIGESIIYHQSGNAYLEFYITVRNPAAISDDPNEIRLIDIAFAYCFKEAFSSTTGGSDLKHSNYVGQVSTKMKSLTSKDGHLS